MHTGELRPDDANDPIEFVDLLRQLKKRSRLTYRQLEQRAASAGDVLARSTAADVLGRATLPRPEVLAAFVRACGAEDQVEVWLRARHRLAAGSFAPTSPAPDHPPAGVGAPATAPEPLPPAGTRPRWFPRPGPLALLVVGVLLGALGAGAWFLRPDGERRPSAERASAEGSRSTTPRGDSSPSTAPSGGRSQIRPVRAPQLCLTEGRDRTGRYESEVAVQRPCAQATPPDTYLEPVPGGLYLIKWNHPAHGPGCLTIRRDEPGRHLLEPWTNCLVPGSLQLFRFEPTGSAPTTYRIRPANTELCVGLRDDDTEVLAEALAEPCTDTADQVFLVDALPDD
ncbi:helix-turn-helix domain-containing protein [Micromonospora sp. 067-2]|uniref:helix-turn-helix domain-containing protein n=1 Tax=Micromonospora sp. 067-2 TaxID=2789270 RepID=UPI00397B1B9F